MTISQMLRSDIEHYAGTFRTSSDLLSRASTGRLTYATIERYLASIRFLLQHTPPYLVLARRAARARGEHALARYFETKLGEEDGHAEWAAADLEKLAEISGVAGPERPEPSVVRLMERVREVILRDPFLYLPYILFTEYFTVLMGPEWVRTLEEHCGVPRSAMSAVSEHAELDRGHVEEGCREIDALVRDESLHEPLRAMLAETMSFFSAFCDGLCAAAA